MRLTLIPFIKRQIDQISAEGWHALQSKLIKFMRLVLLPLELPFIFLAFSLVLLIRGLRPFVTIRIGELDLGRIGGIYHGEWYLSEKAYAKTIENNILPVPIIGAYFI